MRDASPDIPTPASLEVLSQDAWRALREAAGIAETLAPVFEVTAKNLRGFLAYFHAAEKLLTISSVAEQAAAATALFAAFRECDSSVRSAADMISKFNLALATPAGTKES